MAKPTIKQLRTWIDAHAFLDCGADLLDYVWRITLEELLRHQPAIARKVATLTTTADQETIDLSALPASWHRDRFVQAWIGDDPLHLRSESHVRFLRKNQTGTDQPDTVAVLQEDDDTALLHPTPDDAYSVRWIFDEPLTVRDGAGDIAAWLDGTDSAGTGDAANHRVNIDERWARMAMFRGAPAVLQHADPNARFTSRDWQLYVQWCQDLEATPDEPIIMRPHLL